MRPFASAVLLLAFALPALASTEHDDCDANFIAFIGADAYQFSPGHPGELGAVRLFTILSYERAVWQGRSGGAFWKLSITPSAGGPAVFSTSGRTTIESRGAALAEFFWDGRDDSGMLVPPGKYRYTFTARFLHDAPRGRGPMTYDEVFIAHPADEAYASTDEVIVDYALTPETAQKLRASLDATNCQRQQNTPMEAGFPFSFYYGSTHAHSNWSDGGHPTTSCSSGNAYGSGTYAPADVFSYARSTALMDFWVVNEHNHLINDAVANNDGPVTEAKVRQRYADGLAAANAASVDGTFVGIYGMEWGVTTNADQGHVTLLETPKLFGWETCSTCNGPNPECTPGTNCYFDVFTPKRFGYLTLYQRSVENPSSAGALGILNHPGSGHFDGYAFNANADAALQGIAVRSGLAFSTAADCSSTNVGATDYSLRWKAALDKGFHLGPVADHDSHCNNYGVAIPTRTVYLAPSLTKPNLLAAHKARHFFASEDSNVQLVFRSGSQIMGDIFTAAGGATLNIAAYDPDGETISTLELWRGQIGAGVPSAPYQSWSNLSSASVSEPLTSGTYYYYVHAVQADGHDVWSAPMWITYSSSGSGDTTAPTTSITAPAAGATVSGTTLVTAAASDDVGVTRVEFHVDGALQSTDTAAPWEWSWNTTSFSNASHSLSSKAYDAGGNAGTSGTVTVTVSNAGGSGIDVAGWKIVQANATYEYVVPANTVIPEDGYLVIGRSADRASFEAFWNTTLPANAVYLNSGGGMPVINGDENYTLYTAAGAVADGPTINLTAGKSVQRTDPCSNASSATSWNVVSDVSGTPGSGAGAGCGGGVKINEFSDASGTGNYIYEFIELHNDSGSAGTDTTPPSTSVTAPAAGAVVAGATLVTATAADDTGVTKVEFYLDDAIMATDTSAPYEWSWNTTTTLDGTHSVTSKAFDAADNSASSAAVSVTVDNSAPSTSITAPAAGVTVAGTTLVTASASDNTAVTAVEFLLDGVLKSTDTTAPYEWSWDTTSAANGSHSLTSRASDSAGNSATSAAVSVTVSNSTSADISGWKVTQSNSTLTWTVPAGTAIPSLGYVIIARNATKEAFEAFWGRTLASNVVYINSADGMPQINGSETYTLFNAAGTKVDGATVAMSSSAGQSLQRTKPCQNANKSASWSRVSASSATPGSGAPAPCGKGVFISEFSDAIGTGSYVYEFVELGNDQ